MDIDAKETQESSTEEEQDAKTQEESTESSTEHEEETDESQEEESQEFEDEEEEDQEEDEEDENETRFDQHPRFQELKEERDEYLKQTKRLQDEISDLKKSSKEEVKPKSKGDSAGDVLDALDERNFLKGLGITNTYDKEKILETVKPMAKLLQKQGKATDYESALAMANAIENLDTEIDNKVAKALQGKKTTVPTSSGGKSSTQEVGLTKTQLRVAREMGISPKEYRKYI